MIVKWSALLALPTSLLTLVCAVPAPADFSQQHPLDPSPETLRSPWRTLSARLIERIWDIEPQDDRRHGRRRPPLSGFGSEMVLRFNVSNGEEMKSLQEAVDTLLLDVWEVSKDWVDVRLSQDIVGPLLGLLPSTLQNAHAPLLDGKDLVRAVDSTYAVAERSRHRMHSENSPYPRHQRLNGNLADISSNEDDVFFSAYQPLSVVDPWMRFMASIYSTHVQKISIGTSAQGRDIAALRVGRQATDSDTMRRRTVLITGGLHAREWISTSTVNYVAHSLMAAYGSVQATTKLLDDFDFVFVPTVNPDGYAYTWETDRLWRKNRQRTGLRFCQGIDLDRAFDFQWDGESGAGANPCSETYAGQQPFEAVEANELAAWARKEVADNNVTFVGLLDLHSYAQEILYPYSYSCKETPPALENLEELAIGLEKAIRSAHGHIYDIMPACEGNVVGVGKSKQRLWPQLQSSGGSILDWFYHEMRVRYAYQIKLPDKGTYGFLLPKEHIVPTGQEILRAVLHFAEFLADVYVNENWEGVSVGAPTDGVAVHDQVEEQAKTVLDTDLEEDWVWVESLGDDVL